MREENDGFFIITEVIVLFEVILDFLMIHFTCHEIPLNEGALLVELLAGQFIEPGKAVGEESKEGQAAFKFKIVHSFGVIKAKSGALSTTHDADGH